MKMQGVNEVYAANILVKPTLRCNARCIYCHSLRPSVTLTKELLVELFRKLGSFASERAIQNVSVTWHGGEPMIAGPDFYRIVLDLQTKYFERNGIELLHQMNSNLTLYRGETRAVMRDLLRQRRITGCIDPFHPTRLLADGRSYLVEALRSIYRLQADGFEVGMIYVVHRKSLDRVRDLYYYFKNLGVRGVYFHAVEETEDLDYRLSARDYGEFLKRLYCVWEEDQFCFDACPLPEWRASYLEGRPVPRCDYGPSNRGLLHVVVSPEGRLYPCHRFQDKDVHCLGHIQKSSFDEIVNHRLAHLIAYKKENVPSGCLACTHVSLCHSGCVATHDSAGKTMWCEGVRAALDFMAARLRRSPCTQSDRHDNPG